MLLQLTDCASLRLMVSGRTYGLPGGNHFCGMTESSWACDPWCLDVGVMHQVTFIVDGGPKIISVLVDGQLGDGGEARQYGWGRFCSSLRDVNGAPSAHVGMGLRGTLAVCRLYNRALRTSEAVANALAD